VLDAGCGKGRHAVLAARFGAREVLAVDLSSAVEAAYRNTRELPNVHVVQADLFRLPIAPASVDVVYSIGVLHHTPDPEAAFRRLVRCLRQDGRVIVWVYGRENNEWVLRLVDPVRRRVTSRLSHRWLYHLAKLPAAVLYGASHGVYRPLSRPPLAAIGRRLFYQAYVNALAGLSFRDVHLIVYDHLTPHIVSYIPRDEFMRWFHAGDLRDVVVGWHNENSWRGTALKQPREVGGGPDVPGSTA
jgi:SAM-dependent methyltransferase